MSPLEALNTLAIALEPQSIGKINRADYVKIDQALRVIAALISPAKPPDEPVKE
jgi:hypothetical protein